MHFLDGNSKFDFMGKQKLAYAFSLTLILVSLGSLLTQGLNLGIDFTGGYLVELGYEQDVELQTVREVLKQQDFKDAQVQHFGSSKDILIRFAPRADENAAHIGDKVIAALKSSSDKQFTLRRVEFVGPQVGEQLRDQGGIAMLVALLGIGVYVSLRFQAKSALASIVALIHDVIITVGVFTVTQIEFDLTVLAALLALIGYSLNDTVVVLDRIRESFRNVRKASPIEIINLSINQTLSRTLMTSGTTLLVVISLFLFGGETIHGFALALLVGIIIGTYSSIYVASSILLTMKVSKQDFLLEAKSEVVDDRP